MSQQLSNWTLRHLLAAKGEEVLFDGGNNRNGYSGYLSSATLSALEAAVTGDQLSG